MKVLKWIGITLGSLIIILAAIFAFQIRKANKLLDRRLSIEPVSMLIPNDSASFVIGKKWVTTLCADCHSADLGGRMFLDDPVIGKLYAPNITSGEGGISYYSDNHWLKALRHGISSTGKPLLIMPSHEFTEMREEDISGVIAYMKTAAAIDRQNKESGFKPFAKFLLSVGAFGDIFSADIIDHEAPVPKNVVDTSPVARGEYLSVITGCQGCHGENLSGKDTGDPNSPLSSNLTPAGNLKNWDYADFKNFLETGKTKEGKELVNTYMPWKAYNRLPEGELAAIFSYLKSLDPIEMSL